MSNQGCISDQALEEMLEPEVPCGGNTGPIKRPCPNRAAAVLTKTRCCVYQPESFKCWTCWSEWIGYILALGNGAQCVRCGYDTPPGLIHKLYRLL